MARKLYVGNLPYDTNDQDLGALFATAGTVDSVNVMRDMATGRARGFAFVEMATDEDAQKAIEMLHEHQLGGRSLTVNEARPKTAGGGGGFGGGRGNGGGYGGGNGRRSEPRW
jgi:RNA recognition motif-containing protein